MKEYIIPKFFVGTTAFADESLHPFGVTWFDPRTCDAPNPGTTAEEIVGNQIAVKSIVCRAMMNVYSTAAGIVDMVRIINLR